MGKRLREYVFFLFSSFLCFHGMRKRLRMESLLFGVGKNVLLFGTFVLRLCSFFLFSSFRLFIFSLFFFFFFFFFFGGRKKKKKKKKKRNIFQKKIQKYSFFLEIFLYFFSEGRKKKVQQKKYKNIFQKKYKNFFFFFFFHPSFFFSLI